MVLLSHRQIFCEIVLITCGFRSLELLVALLLVLHVVECARVLQILVLLVIVVRSTGLRLASVGRVRTDVLDVVVDLAQLLVDLLIECAISVVLNHPLILLMRSYLNTSLLLVLML